MANYRVAKRYAKAFMEVLPSEKVENAVQEMSEIKKALAKDKKLRSFFSSPIISNDKKMNVSREIFKSFSSEVQRLVHLLIENERIDNLKEVAECFIERYRNINGIKKVVLLSAHPLTTNQVDLIIDKIKEDLLISKDKILIEQKIDESLIGGFILKVDDKQFDSSIKSKLTRIKQELEK